MNAPQSAHLLFSYNGQTINSATTTNGTGCDMIDSNAVIAVLKYGTVTTAATQSVISIEHSDDNSSYSVLLDLKLATAAANGAAAAAPADGDDNKFYKVAIDKRPRKRYLRWSITTTGSPNFVVDSGFFLGVENATNPSDQTASNLLASYTV